MYNKQEIMDAIEAAELNIKTAKEQLKRLEKARNIICEMEVNNMFGFDSPFGDVLGGYGFEKHMQAILEQSKQNLNKYKKMLKLLEQMEALESDPA